MIRFKKDIRPYNCFSNFYKDRPGKPTVLTVG